MRRVALAFCLALAACGPGGVYRDRDVPMSSAAGLDANRYAGLWYEIARFPVPFQAGCAGVTAVYEVQSNGDLSVLNTCRDGGLNGPVRDIRGTAMPSGPGRFQVSFTSVPFISAPYWVLWVDEGYRTAVVGVPSGRAGWILNREPEIPEDRLKAAIEVLDFNGYDVEWLIYTPQASSDLR